MNDPRDSFPSLPPTVTRIACPVCGRIGEDVGHHNNGATGDSCPGRPEAREYRLVPRDVAAREGGSGIDGGTP